MASVQFHQTCLIDLAGLYARASRGDRERIQSELDLLNEFGEEFCALFELGDDLAELWIRNDDLHGVVLQRLAEGNLLALSAWRGDDVDERTRALERARKRRNP